jgi:hypothetical protein
MGFAPERANFFAMSPDRQWLGFTQWVSENVCNSSPPRIFDGPQIVLGDPTAQGAITNKIWPSFPIRYASRREKGGGGGAAAPAAPVRSVPAPAKQGAPGF